jgi:protein-tyrosine phosphatase
MTINPLPSHPKWLRNKLAAFVLWFFSRLNDQWTKRVFIPFVRITPQLMVGPQLNQSGYKWLRENHGVNSIVNLRVEADDRERGIDPDHYLWLPTIDHTSPTVEQLQKAADFIAERIQAGDGVYIHCAAGVGRAPMTAAAYLISQGYTPDDAMKLIRARRPFINQSSNQRTRLIQFAEQVNGKHDKTTPVFPSTP